LAKLLFVENGTTILYVLEGVGGLRTFASGIQRTSALDFKQKKNGKHD
jgi:hypothetical protein